MKQSNVRSADQSVNQRDSPSCEQGSFGLNAAGLLVFFPHVSCAFHVAHNACSFHTIAYNAWSFHMIANRAEMGAASLGCLGVFVAGRWPGSPPLPPPVSVSGCLCGSHKGCQVTVWHTTDKCTQNLTSRGGIANTERGERQPKKTGCADIMTDWTSRNSKHMPVWVNIQISQFALKRSGLILYTRTHTER